MTVTYASLASDDSSLAYEFDAGIDAARARLGREHPLAGVSPGGATLREQISPIDGTTVVGRFAEATTAQVVDAVERASRCARSWRRVPVEDRAALLRRVAERIERDRFAAMGMIVWEAGKTRHEALAEVDEAPVFLRLYADEFEANNAYEKAMPDEAPGSTNVSVMRPYGVWAVIAPLNFPLALATGPTAAALVTGNTVVLKPSPAGQLMATYIRDAFHAEGLPPDALILLTGGNEVGEAITSHPKLGGVTFTGSYAVGSRIATALAPESKPVVAEMGGKNPAIVTATADLDVAAEGIVRSAFGYSGQKCSACSRVFVDKSVYVPLLERVVARAKAWTVDNPATCESAATGPVINRAAVDRLLAAVEDVEASGGRVLFGGTVVSGPNFGVGNYVLPTVVEAPPSSRVWHDELFVPLLAVRSVDSLEEAIALANESEYALTAGIYTGSEDDVATFFEDIESSVLYVNRRSGATTGAWPGVQPISGWKHSGNTGRGTAGPHYLQQYLREQSRTLVNGG